MPPFIRWYSPNGMTGGTEILGNWATTSNNITGGPLYITIPCNIIPTQTFSNTDLLTNIWTTPMGFTTVDQTWSAINQQNMLVMLSQQYVLPVASPHVIRARAADEERIRRVRAAQEEDHARAQALHREREKERAEADKLAKGLLISHLTPEQRKSMDKHGWFVVEGGKTRKKYKIHTKQGPAGNVRELNGEGQEVARYCAHCHHEIPHDDQYLAQKLMLEHDEEVFLRIANRR